MRLAGIALAPVKGTRLTHPRAVEVDRHGLRDDRRFHVVAVDGRAQLGASKPALLQVASEWNPRTEILTLTFPDGRVVEEQVELGPDVTARVTWDGNRAVLGRALVGPWSDALSEHLQTPVVLACPTAPRRAVDVGPVTLVSRATIDALGIDADPRRFRLNLLLDGPEAFAEDGWEGRRVQLGEVVLRVGGAVPRCAAVNSDPLTGERDPSVLRAVARRPPVGGVKAPLGVYATCEQPGRIAAGDPLTLL